MLRCLVVTHHTLHQAFPIRQPNHMRRPHPSRQVLVAEPPAHGGYNFEHLTKKDVPVQAGIDDNLLERGPDRLGAILPFLEPSNLYQRIFLVAVAEVQGRRILGSLR